MSIDIAKDILHKEFLANKGEELEIDFHGGEPMLNFALIKNICEWTFNLDVKCKFLITTNGTLLNQEMKSWLVANKDKVHVALSLDGTRDMHNNNRSNSFDLIDIEFFRSNWSMQPVKMTISELTLPNLAEGVIYLHNIGFNVSFNLAQGLDWNPSLIDVYRSEMNKLVDFYIKNPTISKPINLSKKISAVISDSKIIRSCGSGKDMSSYDTDGHKFPCHMFAENSLSKEDWSAIANTDFEDDSLFSDEECNNCAIYRICPTCYGMNYKDRGDIGKRDKKLCEFNKIDVISLCKLKYNELINKSTEEFTSEDYHELRAVKFLTTQLNISL